MVTQHHFHGQALRRCGDGGRCNAARHHRLPQGDTLCGGGAGGRRWVGGSISARSRLDRGSIGARSGLDLGSIYRYEIDRSTNTPLSPNADAICQKSMLYADVLGNWPGRCRVRGCCRVGRRTSSQVVSQRAVRLPDGPFFSRQCRVAAGCCQVCRVAAGARAQDAVAIRQEAAAAGAPPVYS